MIFPVLPPVLHLLKNKIEFRKVTVGVSLAIFILGFTWLIGLSNATLVSLHKDGGKNWIASVVPSEGAWEAKLILKVGNEAIEVPLVVAPRVELDANVSERNFLDALDRYCSDQDFARKWENVPHLNDYIFTVNYLANLGNSDANKASR
jgi:hypothetical protein